jgi:hypothetical protein
LVWIVMGERGGDQTVDCVQPFSTSRVGCRDQQLGPIQE